MYANSFGIWQSRVYNISQDPCCINLIRNLCRLFERGYLFDMDSVNVIKSEWCFCAFVVHSPECSNNVVDVVLEI